MKNTQKKQSELTTEFYKFEGEKLKFHQNAFI